MASGFSVGKVVPNIQLAVLLCLVSIIQAVFLVAKSLQAWLSNQQLNSYKKYQNKIFLMDFMKDEL